MKNPLNRRLPRELRGEIGKYLVIFLLLTATIGFVSGFLVADNSMIAAYHEGFEKYHIENGNFKVTEELSREQQEAVEKEGVTLYENFYTEEEAKNGSTLRIFKDRETVNLVCLMEGEMPEAEDAIVIDRMYAGNNQISVGDRIEAGDRSLTVTGLVALPDYSCLFSDNHDSMFDAVKFGVGVMTPEGMEKYGDSHLSYSYSWLYDEEPEDELEEKKVSDDLMETMAKTVPLEDYIPSYLNQAIMFTGEDMGRDRAMMITLLYIVIVIMAFVFGVTASNTINREASVIGTLRASGYTKGELVRHYMVMPLLVTVAGAIVGNILGYTVFKNVCAGLYYGSYSLPTYVTLWNADAFLLTTAVPFVLMLVINLLVLARKLSLPPLQFLRRELRRRQKRRTMPLSVRIPFFSRFRIRIILQNVSNYVLLFAGIIFANLLLMFGLLLPPLLDNFQEEITENLICEYQYLLKAPVPTGDKEAEPFAVYSLNTPEGRYKSEKISIYGIGEDSSYLDLDFDGKEVYITDGYAEKFGVKAGDTITLKERYEDKEYTFSVAGTYDYPGALSVFMDREVFCDTFDYEEGYFNGYFSDREITDMDETYIASVIGREDLTKLSRQLDVSMGGMMLLVDGFAVAVYMVLLYLLSKIVIEKNAQSISMAKILGYTGSEISRLYIVSTAIVAAVSVLVSLPIETAAIRWLYINMMMDSISGWITYSVPAEVYGKIVGMGFAAYGVIAAIEYRKIRRVPMNEALKNVE